MRPDPTAAQLQKLAADFDVPYADVLALSFATHGAFERLTPENKARVSDASLRLFKALGSDAARTCYLKIREAVAPAHLKGIAA